MSTSLMPTELLKDAWQHQETVYPDQWWYKKYWESTDGSHRDAIILALERVGEFSSVLEVGCNTGPNLRRIHMRWPRADLMGMDIHSGAINYGRARAKEEGWYWTGYAGDLRDLGLLGADIADVVLSCYSLAYLDPRDIVQAVKDLYGMARKALVIAEPMVPQGEPIKYAGPRPGVVPEYHHPYLDLLATLGPKSMEILPIQPPEGRLSHCLVVVKS